MGLPTLDGASCHLCSNFGKHSHKWFHSLMQEALVAGVSCHVWHFFGALISASTSLNASSQESLSLCKIHFIFVIK